MSLVFRLKQQAYELGISCFKTFYKICITVTYAVFHLCVMTEKLFFYKQKKILKMEKKNILNEYNKETDMVVKKEVKKHFLKSKQ